MAGRARSTDPRAERVRERMKRAARDLIHEQRVESISVSDVVARAGVSRQVFYQHFDDRDEAIASALKDDFDAAAARADSSDPDAVIRTLLEYASAHGTLYGNLYPSVASQRATQAFRAKLRPACRAIVRELWGARPDGPSEEALTTFLLGGIMELLTDWAADPTDQPPVDRVEPLLRSFRALMSTSPS